MPLYADVYFVFKLYFVFRYITVNRIISSAKYIELSFLKID